MRALIAIMAPAVLAGCAPKADNLWVEGAWVRLPAALGLPGAAYFTVRGGAVADRLVGVTAPFAQRAELHESGMDGHGRMRMAPIATIAVPAGGKVRFAPGDRHAMLFGIDPKLQAGARAPLIFTFASGRKIEAAANIAPPGTVG